MNCLIDYIGLRRSSATIPLSGLYINDLPGIDLKSIESIADGDHTMVTLWDAIQQRAAKIFETTFVRMISTKTKLRRISGTVSFDTAVNLDQITAPMQEYRGMVVPTLQGAGGLMQINIEGLDLFLKFAENTTIKVMQESGAVWTEIQSIDIIGHPGWNHIDLSLVCPADSRCAIVYDASTIHSVSLPITAVKSNSSLKGFMVPVRGITYDGSIAVYGRDSYGLSGTVSVSCSYLPLICRMRSALTLCWWYLLGSELMAERCVTDRINRYTTVDLSKARELRQKYRDQFLEELSTEIEGLALDQDWCLECNEQLRSVTMMP